ncbi:MAG: hypothetical protein JSW58_03715 [Candidatus Latescibacterota bacterium]|nr:MAG: hypothetical protein JSW58_03715 [Candidatus Latescibacterota bacterium]
MSVRNGFVVGKILFGVTVGLLILNTSAHGLLPGSGVVFEREHIKIFVSEGRVRVEGLYVFANHSATMRHEGLFYPFPIDSLHPEIENVTVHIEGDTASHQHVEDGIVFVVRVPGHGSAVIEVIYEQTCLDRSACYILTSTAFWDRPLERAGFEIHVPGDFELEWVAYDVDTVSVDRDTRIHEFVRTDFMPDKDLCFRWRHRRARTENKTDPY